MKTARTIIQSLTIPDKTDKDGYVPTINLSLVTRGGETTLDASLSWEKDGWGRRVLTLGATKKQTQLGLEKKARFSQKVHDDLVVNYPKEFAQKLVESELWNEFKVYPCQIQKSETELTITPLNAAVLIGEFGDARTLEGTDFPLKRLYALLECDTIEVVQVGDNILIIDETGKLTGKSPNEEATALAGNNIQWGDKIVGKAVYCPSFFLK
jgi:hypothetical protein